MEEEFLRLELKLEWEEHFQKLLEGSRSHTYKLGESESNRLLNRYLDVKPYDHSRVKLLRVKDNDYINANLVTVPKAARKYILTQGPLPDTLGHFWLMVWEQKSTVIVMLNRVLELEDFVKCEPYWPKDVGSTVKYGDEKLTVTLKSQRVLKHYTIREMLLEDEETKKSRLISQFHYTAWPDHGEPDSPASLLRLLTAIRKSGGLDKMDEPTIVHCSAGIGRSGTFCLIDCILSMVENQGSTEGIDIDNTLVEMRDYRMGLIQTPIQLRFAYMSIIYGIKILEKANKLNPHISSIKDNASQQQKTNGSTQGNGKKSRRSKKKQNSNASNQLNIFNKHLLVEALDDIDSDEADELFYLTMEPLPKIKKPRNSTPADLNETQPSNLSSDGLKSDVPDRINQQISATTRAQLLTNAMNSILTENTISADHASSISKSTPNSATSTNTDSVLLRRRERELRILEKTVDIKNRMKAEELKRERYAQRLALFKKSALYGGVAALVLSSIAYVYLHGNTSS